MKKTVFIRRKNPNTKIPEYIHKESTKKLSSVWIGNGVLRGLTSAEEMLYLPKVLGVSVNSQDWESELKTFWADFSHDIPSGNGLEVTVEYRQDGTPVPEVDNLQKYILLQTAMKHPKVAPNEEALRGARRKIFYIFDPVQKAQQDANTATDKANAMKVYLEIYQDKAKVHQVLTVMEYHPENFTSDEITATLLSAFEKDPERFVKVVRDERLEIKYFIASLVKANVVKLDEGIYFDVDRQYGTLDKFINYLNDPLNSQERMRMEAKVENLLKVVSKMGVGKESVNRPDIDDNPFKEGARSVSAKAEDIKNAKAGSASKEKDSKEE